MEKNGEAVKNIKYILYNIHYINIYMYYFKVFLLMN